MKLYVKQKVISWSDKFNVKNAEKEDMYFVEGEFFSMGSKLHIYNKFRDEVGFVKQNFFSLRPRFEVYRSGVKSAEVIKKYNWLEPEYDINGLDLMESKIGEARTNIVESLKYIQDLYRKKPDPFLYFMQVIIDSKSDELVNIFTEAFPEEKSRVIQILTEIDPANKTKYEKITSTNLP